MSNRPAIERYVLACLWGADDPSEIAGYSGRPPGEACDLARHRYVSARLVGEVE